MPTSFEPHDRIGAERAIPAPEKDSLAQASPVSEVPQWQGEIDDVHRRESMKAIVQHRYGSPDVLQLREIDQPVAGDDEVLVRVHAAGVDQGVWHITAGLPYLIRLAGYGIRSPKNPVPGADLAGVVEAVGKGVTRFQPGDEVFGIGRGSFAEYACARKDKLAAKPLNLSFEQAAAVAISGLPALQGLRDHGKVRPGQKVLIIGASGGVGTYAVQLGKALEAEVTAVCSTAKLDMVSSIGADHVIDYKREDFAGKKHHYDVILDIGGNSSLSRLRRAVTPKGKLVITEARQMGAGAGSGASIADSGEAAVALRRPDADHVHLARELRGHDRAQELHRSRSGQAGHRQDVPAGRSSRGDPLPQRRACTRQGRHHRAGDRARREKTVDSRSRFGVDQRKRSPLLSVLDTWPTAC